MNSDYDKPYTSADLHPSTQAFGGPSGRLVATVVALEKTQEQVDKLMAALAEVLYNVTDDGYPDAGARDRAYALLQEIDNAKD